MYNLIEEEFITTGQTGGFGGWQNSISYGCTTKVFCFLTDLVEGHTYLLAANL